MIARLRAMDPWRLDVLIAAVVAADLQLEVLLSPAPADDRVIAHLLGAVMALAMLLRTRAPVLCVAIAFGAFTGFAGLSRELTENLFGPFFLALFLMASLGALASTRGVVAGAAIAVAAMVVSGTIDDYDDTLVNFLAGVLLIVAAPVAGGRLLANRTRLNRALRDKAERLERERAARAEQAALRERARIAGELHDVVAHALSAMVVQASGARRMAAGEPGRAGAAFGSIEETGREALTEIRRLLGVLRREDEEIALAPQPSLAHLSTLVRRAEAAGLPVDVQVEGDAVPLPAGLDLTAYRVVQEALGGALEEGGAGRARVVVRYRAQHIELEVADDGHEEADARRLLGVRERLSVFGGDLQAERRPGGHLVRARLPVGGT